jgi:hypothetical protein
MLQHMSGLLTRSLGVVCPSCDFLNIIGATRCMACGSPTDVSKVEASGQPPGLRRTGHTPAPMPAARLNAVRPAAPFQVPETQPAHFESSAVPLDSAPISRSGPQSALKGYAPTQTPMPQTSGVPRFSLTVVAGPSSGQRFRLGSSALQVGRSRGIVLFPDDPFVSSLHATFALKDGRLFVRDEGSHSGVFVSISVQETVLPGSLFSAGIRLFRYAGSVEPQPPLSSSEPQIYGAPLSGGTTHYLVEEILLGGRVGRSLLTPGPVLKVGRSRCEFSYPMDDSLAAVHCEVAPLPHGAMIRDLSAGTGTFVRIAAERALKANDRIRVGQHTIQVEVGVA